MSKIEEFKSRTLSIDGRTETCRECGGGGEVARLGRSSKCRRCGGSGRVKVEQKDPRRR